MQDKVRKLETLVEISRQLGILMDFGPLLQCINDAVASVLDCERASIFLYDSKRNELYSVVSTGESQLRFEASRGIAGHTLHSKEITVVSDAYNDPRFNSEIDSRTGFKTDNLLSVPLLGFDGSVVGVLQALNKKGSMFEEEDAYYAGILGSLAGTTIQRQMLFEGFLEKQKLAREMELAQQIQQSLLPRENPALEGFDIAGWNQPANHTGGDFFDFVPLTGSRMAVLFGDATGHGVGPALIISECRALTRALLTRSSDISAILDTVNEILVRDLQAFQFVTMFFGVLDAETSTLEFASAGQAPLFVCSRRQPKCASLVATTRPLGLIPGLGEPSLSKVSLEPGDIFGLFTDGFYEWSDPNGGFFGSDRIARKLEGSQALTASRIIQDLYGDVREFSQGTAQEDDLTAVVIRRLP